jgi:hypothetical protein
MDKERQIEEGFQHMSEAEAWEFYLSNTVGNSFCWGDLRQPASSSNVA